MEFLFRCMTNGELDIKERIDCAKAIMPYQHRKMPQAVEAEGLNLAAIHLHF